MPARRRARPHACEQLVYQRRLFKGRVTEERNLSVRMQNRLREYCHSPCLFGTAGWPGASHLTSGSQRSRTAKRARIAWEPLTRPRGRQGRFACVWGRRSVPGCWRTREPRRDARRSGRAVEVRRIPGGGPFPWRGRWKMPVKYSGSNHRSTVVCRKRGRRAVLSASESGLARRRFLHFQPGSRVPSRMPGSVTRHQTSCRDNRSVKMRRGQPGVSQKKRRVLQRN